MLEQNTMRLMITLAGIVILGVVLYFMAPYMGAIQESMKEVFVHRPRKF